MDSLDGSFHRVPAKPESGVFGHVRAFWGVIEPQMRTALHIHMLIQLLRFSHPWDLFQSNTIPETFRRLWYFVASMSFTSTEGYAAYPKTAEAMSALSTQPLLPLTKKQCGMIERSS